MITPEMLSSFSEEVKVATVWMKTPIEGDWKHPHLPDRVEVGGKVYLRGSGFDRYGSVARYREDKPRMSQHLYVIPGRYVIDHQDEDNPHHSPIRHALEDMIPYIKDRLAGRNRIQPLEKRAFLGSLAVRGVQRNLAETASKQKKDTPRFKELRRRLEKASPTDVHVMAADDDRGPHYDERNGKARVSIRKGEDPAILAHELGHAELDRETIGRIVQSPTVRIGAVIATMIGSTVASAKGHPGIGTAIASLASLPTLAYEGWATSRGLKQLETAGATPEEMSAARKRLTTAWGSYGLIPVAAAGDYATMRLIAHLARQ